MCGITCVVGKGLDLEPLLKKAEAVQRHRGPDAQGTMVSSIGDWQVGLGHQRLAIIDLSPTGNQPMSSVGGTSTLVFNGEVYNYVELRKELEALGRSFCSGSDTEVVLVALETWGPD